MNRKVTPEQIEQLFAFTKQHYVEYYDLQCELADHLANAIEQRWKEQPGIDFTEALKIEFKKFGIFGFTTVVEQREQALSKKYHKLMLGYFREFFKLPRILFTLIFAFLVFNLIEYHILLYAILMIGACVFGGYKIIAIYYDHRKKVKKTGKRWLFEDIIKKGGGLGLTTYAPFMMMSYGYQDNPSTIGMIFMAGLFTAFVLYQYIILYLIPSKAEAHLLKAYPEYNL